MRTEHLAALAVDSLDSRDKREKLARDYGIPFEDLCPQLHAWETAWGKASRNKIRAIWLKPCAAVQKVLEDVIHQTHGNGDLVFPGTVEDFVDQAWDAAEAGDLGSILSKLPKACKDKLEKGRKELHTIARVVYVIWRRVFRIVVNDAVTCKRHGLD